MLLGCAIAEYDDDKALCCDGYGCNGCNKWIYVSCDQYITESIYDELVQQPSSDPWFCNNRIVPSIKTNRIQHHLGYLHCICLNARACFPSGLLYWHFFQWLTLM